MLDRGRPSKDGAFAWLFLQGRILSSVRLSFLGLPHPFKCVLCDLSFESSDHLLLQCHFAHECCTSMMHKLHWYSLLNSTLLHVFNSWPRLFTEAFFSIIWEVSSSIIIWNVWWARNRRVFRKEKNSIQEIVSRITSNISEVVNAHVMKNKIFSSPFTSWDSNILFEWALIKLPFKGSLLNNSKQK
ncbi:hypothetical protein SUGI_0466250 [Cryptomeria japonica]|nr:hypothetical protein SUGI_0466250 [Cryptomeria japonica]